MKTVNLTNLFSRASNRGFHQGRLAPLVSVLIACAINYGAMASASATTIYVNNQATGTNTGDSWVNAYTSIGPALYAATVPADIWVAGGTYPVNYCNNTIPNNVNIYGGFAGNETQINGRPFNGNLPAIQTKITEPSGGTNCYLFSLVGTANIFNGLTLEAIGGILQSGGAVTLISDTFTRGSTDQATAVGGSGIVSYNNAILTVDKSLFQNLLASIGGALAGLNAASITIANSTFSGNRAGGASYYDSVAGVVKYLSGGGAIAVDGNFSYLYFDYGPAVNNTKVTINGNIFTSNTAGQPSGGGAINVTHADTVSIANSTFGTLDTNGGPILANSNNAVSDIWWVSLPNANGGAILVTASNQVTLNGDKFYGNLATAGGGGAIYSTAENQNGSISITASTFNGNSASVGGAIGDAAEKTGTAKTVTVVIKTSTFTNNTATSRGPAISYDGTEASIDTKTASAAIDKALQTNNPTLRNADIYP